MGLIHSIKDLRRIDISTHRKIALTQEVPHVRMDPSNTCPQVEVKRLQIIVCPPGTRVDGHHLRGDGGQPVPSHVPQQAVEALLQCQGKNQVEYYEDWASIYFHVVINMGMAFTFKPAPA